MSINAKGDQVGVVYIQAPSMEAIEKLWSGILKEAAAAHCIVVQLDEEGFPKGSLEVGINNTLRQLKGCVC